MHARVEIQYDGIRLSRLMPVAWLVCGVLTWLANTFAVTDMSLLHPRIQTLLLLAAFAGVIGVGGTIQMFSNLRDRGRTILAGAVAAGFITFSMATTFYGFWMFFT